MNETAEQQKILIVDDTPVNIQVLNEALRGDYRVFFATSGKDALKMAAANMPDLILLDVMMPGMNGYEVCRALKADPLLRDIPVIFITALTQQEDESAGLELGAVDYIAKPFNPVIVRLRVRNHMELKRQRDLLNRLSLLDGLTGLANRRAFDDYFDREWRRSQRTGLPLSLILLDVDHFKDFNDAYGHLAGDETLKQLAGALVDSLERPGDLAARYGGEEFVCVLPETGHDGVMLIAERLMAKIDGLQIPHERSPVAPRVTISMGAATMTATPFVSADTLLELADQYLYQAKNEGRNRLVYPAGPVD